MFVTAESHRSLSYHWRRFTVLLEEKPLIVPALLGGVFVLPLPIYGLVLRIIMCNYGLGTDMSGVGACLPPLIMLGTVLGALAGLIGKGAASLLNRLTKHPSANVIGTAFGSLLAIAAGIALSPLPFFLFMFPDC